MKMYETQTIKLNYPQACSALARVLIDNKEYPKNMAVTDIVQALVLALGFTDTIGNGLTTRTKGNI